MIYFLCQPPSFLSGIFCRFYRMWPYLSIFFIWLKASTFQILSSPHYQIQSYCFSTRENNWYDFVLYYHEQLEHFWQRNTQAPCLIFELTIDISRKKNILIDSIWRMHSTLSQFASTRVLDSLEFAEWFFRWCSYICQPKKKKCL